MPPLFGLDDLEPLPLDINQFAPVPFPPQDANQVIFNFNDDREITEIQEETIQTPQIQSDIIDIHSPLSLIAEIHDDNRNFQNHIQNLNNAKVNQRGNRNRTI